MKNSERPINPILDLNEDKSGLRGLTKREYFAGLAMQALISNSSIVPRIQPDNGKDLQLLSMTSISIADELLKQLKND